METNGEAESKRFLDESKVSSFRWSWVRERCDGETVADRQWIGQLDYWEVQALQTKEPPTRRRLSHVQVFLFFSSDKETGALVAAGICVGSWIESRLELLVPRA